MEVGVDVQVIVVVGADVDANAAAGKGGRALRGTAQRLLRFARTHKRRRVPSPGTAEWERGQTGGQVPRWAYEAARMRPDGKASRCNQNKEGTRVPVQALGGAKAGNPAVS